MTKLFTRATVTAATLSGAQLKTALTTLWDAMSTLGFADATRSTITATATLTATQTGLRLVDATSGAIVLTLQASGTAGDDTRLELRRIDSTVANSVTLQRAGADTIEGGTSITLPVGSSCTLMLPAGSSNWRVLNISGSTAANTRLHIGADVPRRVQGLVGANNSGTPTTQWDMSADSVTLRDSAGASVVRQVTGTLTCNLSTAGPAANGRDQAGVFSASQFIRLFFIWNGAALATIASSASPTTGPALPSGYTHWAYAATVYWNSSSNIVPTYARGRNMHYQTAQSALAVGGATSPTSVSVSTLVPSEALRFGMAGTSSHLYVTATAGGVADVTANVGISSTLVPYQLRTAFTGGASAGLVSPVSRLELANVAQAFTYNVSASLGTAPTLSLAMTDYTVPNGDA